MTAIPGIPRRPAASVRRVDPPVRVLLAGIVLLAVVGIGWAGYRALARTNPRSEFDGFRLVRIRTIQTQLDQVVGPYIVVMGDSHAERLYLSSLCGLPVVNAGMSGATVGDVLDLARAITPPRKAAALLLSVGTNDIWVKRNPETDHAENAFRSGLASLNERLVAWSDHRTLIGIPPVASKEETNFPRAAAQRYSHMLEQTCEAGSCHYRDLFATAGSPEAERSAFSDGVHLRNYASYVRAQEVELCQSVGLAAQR